MTRSRLFFYKKLHFVLDIPRRVCYNIARKEVRAVNKNKSEVEEMTNEQYKTQLLITIRTLRIIAKETKSIDTILEALNTIEETIKKPQ